MPSFPAHVERRHLALVATGCAGLGAAALLAGSRSAVGLPCPLRTLTGLDCPLCGATRATLALLHGAWPAALDHNALYVIALPFVAAIGLVWLVRGTLPGWVNRGRAPLALLAVAISFVVLRNLPFEPFSILGSDLARQ